VIWNPSSRKVGIMITTYGNVYFEFPRCLRIHFRIFRLRRLTMHIYYYIRRIYSENSKTLVVIWNPSSRKVGIMITTWYFHAFISTQTTLSRNILKWMRKKSKRYEINVTTRRDHAPDLTWWRVPNHDRCFRIFRVNSSNIVIYVHCELSESKYSEMNA